MNTILAPQPIRTPWAMKGGRLFSSQFRILYREFLFRMVDLELIAPQGDISRLLGQFASLLIFLSVGFTFAAMGFGGAHIAHAELLMRAWILEHVIIATTMVIVGIFAVLSWDSTFLDQRDVLALAPLPIRMWTLFGAKAAAFGSALGLTVVAFNALTSLALSMALAPDSSNLLDLILSPALYRTFLAYWITMISAGTFLFCCVLSVQGLASQLLSRRWFLHISAFLQIAALCLFLSVYFLQPSLATPAMLAAPANQRALACLPSYWFLGLFQQLNGSMHPAMVPLASRAWTSLAVSLLTAVAAYGLSYFRTLRKIVEEPDITPGVHRLKWLPRFGGPLATAIVHFSIRTLSRSRQHRVMLAFYLGVAFAIVILLIRAGVSNPEHVRDETELALLFASFLIMTAWVIGTRVVFAMPLALKANWIFRLTQIRPVAGYLAAIRRPLFVLAVFPVWLASAAFFLSMWPWRRALEHLAILGLWGILIAYLSLHGFQKIPFTCSYLPGKSQVHMAVLAAVALLLLIGRGVPFERRAFDQPAAYAASTGLLAVLAGVARWRTMAAARSDEAIVQFEDAMPPVILELGLRRDGTSHLPSTAQ